MPWSRAGEQCDCGAAIDQRVESDKALTKSIQSPLQLETVLEEHPS